MVNHFPHLFHKNAKIAKRSRIFLFAKDVILLLIGFHHAVVVAELDLWRRIIGIMSTMR